MRPPSNVFRKLERAIRLRNGTEFLSSWWYSRRWENFAWGIVGPVILLLVAGAVFVVRAGLDKQQLIERYEITLRDALIASDSERALVCLKTLVDWKPNSTKHKYHLAILLGERGEADNCQRIMRELAPPDRNGLPAAHLWLAEHMLTRLPPAGSKADRAATVPRATDDADGEDIRVNVKEIVHHLSATLSTNLKSHGHRRLAELYLRLRQPSLASDHVNEVANEFPELRLQLARSLLRVNPRQARAEAIRAAADYRGRVAAAPTDLAARLDWAEALSTAGLLNESARILSEGLALGDNPDLRSALAEVYLQASARQTAGGVPGEPYFALVEKAFQIAPTHPDVIASVDFVLASQISIPSAQLVQFKSKLNAAVDQHSDNHQLRALLAELQVRDGDYQNAIDNLRLAGADNPRYQLRLARIHRRMNDEAAAVAQATIVRDAARAQTQSQPTDVQQMIRWADAESFLGNPTVAQQILEDGLVQERDPRLAAAIVGLLIRRHDQLLTKDKASDDDRLQVLTKAVEYLPRNAGVLRRLGTLARSPDVGPRARSVLTGLLEKGYAKVTIHTILGTNAIDTNPAEARQHLEQAHRLAPNNLTVTNNLAWVLAQLSPLEATRALALINAAIKTSPGSSQLRGTRGEILVKLKRWDEAISDLEFAVKGSPGQLDLHKALALAYTEVGNEQLAAEHDRLAGATKETDGQ